MKKTKSVSTVSLEACLYCGTVFHRKYIDGECPGCGLDIQEDLAE